MKKIHVALVLSIIGLLLWLYPILGMSSNSKDDDNEIEWYSLQDPVDAEKLTDEGIFKGQNEGNNSLFIIDLGGKNSKTVLDIPMGAWAKIRIAPFSSGEIKFFCQYPTGSIDQFLTKRMEKGHSYRLWHQAEIDGDYELWYTLNGLKSSSIRLKVNKSISGRSSIFPSKSLGVGPGSGLASYAAPMASVSRSIGFSAGGAKDINNFRDNIKNDYLPLPTDITYEGLFYDYYFETVLHTAMLSRRIRSPKNLRAIYQSA
jgi:hypothetical protein